MKSHLSLVQNKRLDKNMEDVKAEVSKLSSQATEPGFSIEKELCVNTGRGAI
jgi:hypothetical protein